jgi:RNA polymerase sigma factor (sigma-70 family)
MNPSDAESLDALVISAQGGDRVALESLVIAILPSLRLSIWSAVGRPDLADEVLQECLLAVIEHIHDYQVRGTFLPWVRVVARNRMHEQLRQQARHLRAQSANLDAMVLESGVEAETDPVNGSRLPHCLDRLQPRLREILRRRHVEGVPIKRLAQQFKQSAQAMAALLKRTRRILRDCLQEVTPG